MSPSSEPSGSVGAAEVASRTVILPMDLHARPAGRLVRAAAGFGAVLTVAAGDRVVDARSVLAVMGLNAVAGTAVTVSGTGPDGPAAVDTLAELLLAGE